MNLKETLNKSAVLRPPLNVWEGVNHCNLRQWRALAEDGYI